MKPIRIFGLFVLAVVWLLLIVTMFTRGGGFSFYNIFVAVASGIIIFVPLYRKYFGPDSSK